MKIIKEWKRKCIEFYNKYKKRGVCLILLGSLIMGVSFGLKLKHEDDTKTISSSALINYVNIGKLNTYEVMYKGVTTKYDDNKPEKIDYYVSYEAKIKASIETKDIKFDVKESKKTIYITLPEIVLNEPIVDDTSLDYMFYDEKENNIEASTVALKLCADDLKREINENTKIKELARENAEIIIHGLTNPLIKQIDPEYVIEFK